MSLRYELIMHANINVLLNNLCSCAVAYGLGHAPKPDALPSTRPMILLPSLNSTTESARTSPNLSSSHFQWQQTPVQVEVRAGPGVFGGEVIVMHMLKTTKRDADTSVRRCVEFVSTSWPHRNACRYKIRSSGHRVGRGSIRR